MPCLEPWRAITESVLRRFLIRRLRDATRLQFGHQDHGSITGDFQRPGSTRLSPFGVLPSPPETCHSLCSAKRQSWGRFRKVRCQRVAGNSRHSAGALRKTTRKVRPDATGLIDMQSMTVIVAY